MKQIEDLYELSPMQQGMLFLTLQAAPGEGVYLIQMLCTFQGPLDVPAFARAWDRVVERNAILRTSFHWKDVEKPLQVVQRKVELPLQQQDWRELEPAEQERRLAAFIKQDQQLGFELGEAPLMRLALIRFGEHDHRLLWTFHHIVLEGWSASLLLNEAVACYRAMRKGQQPELPARRPYRDYILWLQQQDASTAEAFWREALRGFTVPTPLGVDRPAVASSQQPTEYLEEKLSLGEGVSESLRTLARRHRLTLNSVVQGAWALVLGRYSGDEDVLFGTVVSGRPATLAGADAMVGLFINTLAARVRLPRQEPLVAWLQRLQAQQVEMRQYEYSSLIDVQGWSQVPRGVPLFESILVFENWLGDLSFREWTDEFEVRDVRCIEGGTGYPLTLGAAPGPELLLSAAYDSQRFEAGSARRLLGHLAGLLEEIAANPERRAGDLALLGEEEKSRLADWNRTEADYPRDACVQELFEAQVRRSPDAPAASCGDETLTYAELNRSANRVARHLRSLGVGPQVLVGVLAERSLEMLVAVLGVLKAGAAYVPLDPAYPRERLSFMLQDSGLKFLLTQSGLAAMLDTEGLRVVCLDAEPALQANDAAGDPTPCASPADLAYVIYTSGSTGRPKGVQVPHAALTNFLCSMRREPGLAAQDTLLSVTTLSFDIAGLELYLPLVSGARVVLVSRDEAADGAALLELLTSSRATVMQATPATWRLLIEAGWQGDGRLKILCGGEALTRDLADELLRRGSSLWNVYGPTETTIWSAAYRVEAGVGAVPIGRPIANTQVHLLDSWFRPVPVGVTGELYIGGDGVAVGYLGRPELTAERFVPDPFNGVHGARLYRTGDLARYLPDGIIECLGRVDHQVKVRGFRIEPGEIENALVQHEGVDAAVVLAKDDGAGDRQLVAYVVPAAGLDPTVTELRSHLKGVLPVYMVPSAFVFLDTLPLLPNGKVDRKALERLERSQSQGEAVHEPPRTPMEAFLAELWREVLGAPQVSVRDNFFDLGGHSLLAIKVIARIEKHCGKRISPRDLTFQTLEQLATHCEERVQPGVETGAKGLAGRLIEAVWRRA